MKSEIYLPLLGYRVFEDEYRKFMLLVIIKNKQGIEARIFPSPLNGWISDIRSGKLLLVSPTLLKESFQIDLPAAFYMVTGCGHWISKPKFKISLTYTDFIEKGVIV